MNLDRYRYLLMQYFPKPIDGIDEYNKTLALAEKLDLNNSEELAIASLLTAMILDYEESIEPEPGVLVSELIEILLKEEDKTLFEFDAFLVLHLPMHYKEMKSE